MLFHPREVVSLVGATIAGIVPFALAHSPTVQIPCVFLHSLAWYMQTLLQFQYFIQTVPSPSTDLLLMPIPFPPTLDESLDLKQILAQCIKIRAVDYQLHIMMHPGSCMPLAYPTHDQSL